ncbi:MAG: alkaline phosphatase [Spirochaetaceae bacterium]|jgi:alkaline phosphatase|nr:alkaline phosphatase [Spirochaetaceae bacterium]
MKKRLSVVLILALFVSTLVFASPNKDLGGPGGSAFTGKAKYIFVFIGDGTSITQRTAAELYLANKNNPQDLKIAVDRASGKFPAGNGVTDFTPSIQRMLMSGFPGQGFSSTYSSNSLITDSSSSATAIATGNKTRDGVVGMDPTATIPYTSMAKMAKAKGMKVGIVTTVSLDHATPASFYASSPSRNNYYAIASQIPSTNFDYFAGGGFLAKGTKENQTKDIADVLKEGGYQVYNTRADFDKLKSGDSKVVVSNPRLDWQYALPYSIDMTPDDITFAQFVSKGIEVLDNPNGFFMMAECGKVDWSCHANDAVASILDVLTLDEGVKAAYDFYQKHPTETLIVVTGDHETGGMTLGFAGTHYDTFLSRLHAQKISYDAFDNTVLFDFFEKNPNAVFDDILPIVEQYFGLKRYTKAEMDDMNAAAKNGDAESFAKLGLALQDYEIADLQSAFNVQPKDPNPTKRQQQLAELRQDPAFDIAYGSYSPFTLALTHTLNQKAGISWTSFSHTGLPTPVSVIGVGADLFNGYYDNTDIFKKVVRIGGL